MARLIGVDVKKMHVRAVLIRTGRKPTIEQMLEADVAGVGTQEETVRACTLPLIDAQIDGIAVALEGEQAFVHRLGLPESAKKQLAEVLPFEVEAQLPIELDQIVFDFRPLKQRDPSQLSILIAAARIEAVRQKITQLSEAVGREPDRIGCGALPLANLAVFLPLLTAPEPIALLDLAGAVTDVLVMVDGEPMLARALSIGMRDLPDGAPRLASEIRQTLLAWTAQWPTPVSQLLLVGSGSSDPHACAYLSHTLGLPAAVLPPLELPGITSEHAAAVPRYAKALALALSLERGRDLDLRRGPLVTQRRYDFLKEKMPSLAGLAAAIVISFLFFWWAELRSLAREEALLTGALAVVSKEVLGEETADADRVKELIERGKAAPPGDPMPHADAFDILVKLSEVLPSSLAHDIEEFDMARGKVKINGIVDTQADAQKVPTLLKDWQCARDLKLGKITQVVNDSRQKYSLEFDVRCPEDDTKKPPKRKKDDTTPPAEGKEP